MRFCELRQKEVINQKDGKILGYIWDLDIDIVTGCVCKIIIPGPCKLWGVFGRETEYVIDFCCICQIGPDVILVNVDVEKCLVKCKV